MDWFTGMRHPITPYRFILSVLDLKTLPVIPLLCLNYKGHDRGAPTWRRRPQLVRGATNVYPAQESPRRQGLQGHSRNASAGVAVNYQWVPGLELFVFDCAFMRFIPPIKMCLGEADDDQAVPIYITNYARNSAGTCSLAFKLDPNETWRLPAFVLVGTYFEFRPSEGKLGVARLA
ncbi:hypothetical protein FOZ60_008140 [Perkinsus olseni]|uniref:Peptidase A1 domain-containing protein n=1 Tax=Perkinsus olseni TaxID=32597 RepID=A0A7J6NKM7_PEROL|nr:hypothetical protein FOZ60_008140 [Perkinsus olseni]